MREPLYFKETLRVVIYHRCESGVVVNSVYLIINYFRANPHYLKGAALKAVRAYFAE
jgi:hypothetical protein